MESKAFYWNIVQMNDMLVCNWPWTHVIHTPSKVEQSVPFVCFAVHQRHLVLRFKDGYERGAQNFLLDAVFTFNTEALYQTTEVLASEFLLMTSCSNGGSWFLLLSAVPWADPFWARRSAHQRFVSFSWHFKSCIAEVWHLKRTANVSLQQKSWSVTLVVRIVEGVKAPCSLWWRTWGRCQCVGVLVTGAAKLTEIYLDKWRKTNRNVTSTVHARETKTETLFVT